MNIDRPEGELDLASNGAGSAIGVCMFVDGA